MGKVKIVDDVKKWRVKRIQQISKEFEREHLTSFENKIKYRGLVVIEGIDFSSKCEHHLVGIRGKCFVGYIPNKILPGLSQIPRFIETKLNPTTEITQEQVSKEIADGLMDNFDFLGLILIIKAEHFCMTQRGVRQRNAITTTSEIRGVFWHNEVREEFFNLLRLKI